MNTHLSLGLLLGSLSGGGGLLDLGGLDGGGSGLNSGRLGGLDLLSGSRGGDGLSGGGHYDRITRT